MTTEQALRAIIERADYVCFLPDCAALDGRFTVDELRTIADELERQQKARREEAA